MDRHYSKLHQMVNNGTSRAHITTVRRQITLRVFFNPKNDKKTQYDPKKLKNVDFREKKSLRSYMPSTKVGKNKSSNKIHSKSINLTKVNRIIKALITLIELNQKQQQ